MPLSEISSSFPLFSWTASNGSATDDQTAVAGQALGNEGKCILFSYLVWNDMVDTLRKLQTALSIPWDEEYASYENTRMTKADSSLTAARFNSFRYNLDIIWHPGWPWALPSCPSWLQRNSRSFLAREDVRGYSQYKEQCDLVYGWYLLELVRKMNILIRLMRGDDIAVEMDYSSTIQTLKWASAGLSNAVFVSIQFASKSAEVSHFIPADALLLCAEETNQAKTLSTMHSNQAIPLECFFSSASEPIYHMRVAAAACMDYQRQIRSNTDMAQFAIATAIAVMYQQMHGSRQETSMTPAVIMEVGSQEANIFAESAAAETVEINTLMVRSADQSTAEATMMPFRVDGVVEMDVDAESHTEKTAEIGVSETAEMVSMLRLVTTCEAHLLVASAAGMKSCVDSKTTATIFLHFEGEEPGERWYEPVQTGSNLYIRSAWLFWNDGDKGYIDTDVWYEVIREGSNLYIRSVDYSWKDAEKAYIDLSVFYEPKQKDNNLYIRSADSVWTDGGSANIDTEFFLEPVQDGNNLYIRQNIFGGE